MASSFRDPAGRLLTIDGRIIRIVNKSGASDLNAFLASTISRKFIESGKVVRTDFLDAAAIEPLFSSHAEAVGQFDDSDSQVVVEHERVRFQSFPYEWAPEMLYTAGCLTLDLAENLLAEGFGLKDATPYNILFRGPEPVFIDLLSFERRERRDPTWLPYAQFVRTFLLPLLVNKHFGLRLDQLLTTRRDGLEPEEVYHLCGAVQRLRPPFLTLVSIPAWLTSKNSSNRRDELAIYEKKYLDNEEKTQFILEQQFKRLRRSLESVAPVSEKKSTWSDYMGPNKHFTDKYFETKHAFVEGALAEFRPKNVLDVGCNTGHFSALAARSGAAVVGIDQDPAVVGQVWREAREQGLNVLPLVVDLTRPSPAIGWRNLECPSFLERTRAAFDGVLMLAVIHHMLVSERIPLPQILELAAELTSDLLVIEFVPTDDPMFRRLSRGRDHLFTDLSVESFEAACRRHFEVVRSRRLEESPRSIYLLRKRVGR